MATSDDQGVFLRSHGHIAPANLHLCATQRRGHHNEANRHGVSKPENENGWDSYVEPRSGGHVRIDNQLGVVALILQHMHTSTGTWEAEQCEIRQVRTHPLALEVAGKRVVRRAAHHINEHTINQSITENSRDQPNFKQQATRTGQRKDTGLTFRRRDRGC